MVIQTGSRFREGMAPATASCSAVLSVITGRVQTLLDRLDDIEEQLQDLETPAPPVGGDVQQTGSRIIVGSLLIQHDARRVFINDREIFLSPTEYRLLHELAMNAGRVVPYRKLMRRTGGGYALDSRYLKVYVGRVRAKLSEAGGDNPCQIETVRSVGYRMAADL